MLHHDLAVAPSPGLAGRGREHGAQPAGRVVVPEGRRAVRCGLEQPARLLERGARRAQYRGGREIGGAQRREDDVLALRPRATELGGLLTGDAEQLPDVGRGRQRRLLLRHRTEAPMNRLPGQAEVARDLRERHSLRECARDLLTLEAVELAPQLARCAQGIERARRLRRARSESRNPLPRGQRAAYLPVDFRFPSGTALFPQRRTPPKVKRESARAVAETTLATWRQHPLTGRKRGQLALTT
jgi:hypothetical protein